MNVIEILYLKNKSPVANRMLMRTNPRNTSVYTSDSNGCSELPVRRRRFKQLPNIYKYLPGTYATVKNRQDRDRLNIAANA